MIFKRICSKASESYLFKIIWEQGKFPCTKFIVHMNFSDTLCF